MLGKSGLACDAKSHPRCEHDPTRHGATKPWSGVGVGPSSGQPGGRGHDPQSGLRPSLASAARPERSAELFSSSVPLVSIELFGGISVASTAALELGIEASAIYYSELADDAILVASTVCPQANNLGSITEITESALDGIMVQWPEAHFGLCGGPPCKAVSLLKGLLRQGSLGPQSGLHRGFCKNLTLLLGARSEEDHCGHRVHRNVKFRSVAF